VAKTNHSEEGDSGCQNAIKSVNGSSILINLYSPRHERSHRGAMRLYILDFDY